jgi:hypothetical protein
MFREIEIIEIAPAQRIRIKPGMTPHPAAAG